MAQVKAVLFDLFDTLAYLTSAKLLSNRAELARLAGVDADAWLGAWRTTAMDRMLGRLGSMEDQVRAIIRSLGGDPPDDLVADLASRELAAWRGAANLYPEAEPTLRALKQRGFRLGLISNCSVQAGAVVHSLAIAELFDVLALSFELGVGKPDRGIYEHAWTTLGLGPADCMFVADGAFTELDAAKALGITAVKIEQGHQSGNYGTSTDYHHLITNLSQVLELVGGKESVGGRR